MRHSCELSVKLDGKNSSVTSQFRFQQGDKNMKTKVMDTYSDQWCVIWI